MAAAVLLVSGGEDSDRRTPAGLPGMPAPFLGATVLGDGGLTAAVDAYGSVVDLRRGPAGKALIEIPAERLAAGSVAAEEAIVPRARVGGAWLPLWRADAVRQRYLPGTGVLLTQARFGDVKARMVHAIAGDSLLCLSRAGAPVRLSGPVNLLCDGPGMRRGLRAAAAADRRWLAQARPLGGGAPPWVRRLYERSLLVLRALTDRDSGALAAGARDGWAYVWPRDAGTAALAFAAAGYGAEARRVARFLLDLDLDAAARFDGDGEPVPGRDAQGDAAGWVALAGRVAGLPLSPRHTSRLERYRWRDRADYQEKSPGNHSGNAVAAGSPAAGALVREDARGADSAAAWAVRPFSRPALHPAARRSLRRLLTESGRFGIVPSADWPETDPWTAPTAWSAWAFAALAAEAGHRGDAVQARADRAAALRLMAALRRAATPAGDLPERVDVRIGLPRSTAPLAWSHAFAILTLRELWPGR